MNPSFNTATTVAAEQGVDVQELLSAKDRVEELCKKLEENGIETDDYKIGDTSDYKKIGGGRAKIV